MIAARMDLERIYGFTLKTDSDLASDSVHNLLAYPAGCSIVLFDLVSGQQSHIINNSLNAITCLAFSKCGKYLSSGECGYMPSIRVWDLQNAKQPIQVAEYQTHKYSVQCVKFSSNNKYIISIGCKYDMIVNVWDWRNSLKIASSKISTVIKAVDFCESGKFFVTVGNRHVKFWYLQTAKVSKFMEAIPLIGRSAILGEQRNNDFCGIVCGKILSEGKCYAITKSGLLCEFNEKRLLNRWVDLKVQSANCITSSENLLFIGCSDAVVRCFQTETLQYVTTLPRSHYLGVDISQGLNINHLRKRPDNAKYSSTIAITCTDTSHFLITVYDDHSMYVWNVSDIQFIGKTHSFLFHSSCIWGVEIFPVILNENKQQLPSDTFITFATDDTIRIWNIDSDKQSNSEKNIYSNELMKIVYVDQELTYLKNVDLENSDCNETETPKNIYDRKNGVRCAVFSPDGKFLASGDRIGNIFVYNTSLEIRPLTKIEAHDSEILSLQFLIFEQYHLLASGSRDRFLHIFDTTNNFELIQTISDHKASITSIRFYVKSSDDIRMISCSADKNLFLWKLCRSKAGSNKNFEFVLTGKISGKSIFFDMVIDIEKQLIFAVCHDKNVHTYALDSGRHLRKFRGCLKNEGSCIKITIDRSCSFIAVSCSNKTVLVFSCRNGDKISTLSGHSELVTGLCFSNDCQRLISVGGDGCVFVWKLPNVMVTAMRAKLNQNENNKIEMFFEKSNLPNWARKNFEFEDRELLINDNDTDNTNNSGLDENHDGIVDDDEDGNADNEDDFENEEVDDDSESIDTFSTKKIDFSLIKGKWAKKLHENEDFSEFFSKTHTPTSEDDSAFGSMTFVDSQQVEATKIKSCSGSTSSNTKLVSSIKTSSNDSAKTTDDKTETNPLDNKYENVMKKIANAREKLQNIFIAKVDQ